MKNQLPLAPCPTPDLNGGAESEPGASLIPAPASPSGAELLPKLPITCALELAALNAAELAVRFIREGNRDAARQFLTTAIDRLYEAEVDA